MASAGTQMVMLPDNTQRPSSCALPSALLSPNVAARLRSDDEATTSVATDFGKLTHLIPAAVLYPSSLDDILLLVKLSYASSIPFGIAPRGRGHSIWGQAAAPKDGVVVEMRSLGFCGGDRIRVRRYPHSDAWYADVGGEQLWIDVLKATLKKGQAPLSWTDYLYITVGGTLSNAGIGGQTFRYGPQISNVSEMDVVTGRGEFVTCSPAKNSDLFFAVLGGLGQFGIIVRARIPLAPAPRRVRWMRMLYVDFGAFTRDQERVIAMEDAVNYLEGSLILRQNPINNWRSSFFSGSDQSRILSLAAGHGIIYILDVAKHHNDDGDIDKELEELAEGLRFEAGFKFTRDVSYMDFLNRVRTGEEELEAKGQWDVPHPWLNLFVPKSRISDFDAGVFRNIILRHDRTPHGPILVYPMNRDRWDERTSAAVPEEEVFYTVGLLQSATAEDWSEVEEVNRRILEWCQEAGMGVKQYLPRHTRPGDWGNHFGSKWGVFQERKAVFDPMMILSPGQSIFNRADL